MTESENGIVPDELEQIQTIIEETAKGVTGLAVSNPMRAYEDNRKATLNVRSGSCSHDTLVKLFLEIAEKVGTDFRVTSSAMSSGVNFKITMDVSKDRFNGDSDE